MPVTTSEEAKKLIKEWMVTRSLPTKEADRKDTIFQIESLTPNNIAFVVAQPKMFPRSVFVIAKIEVHAVHLKALGLMDPKKRAEFIWEMKRELVTLPPAFMFQSKDDPETKPEAIQFIKEISFDELTEGKLIDAMDQTCRGIILVTWMFAKAFGTVEA